VRKMKIFWSSCLMTSSLIVWSSTSI
jgi:hypothetical protein